MKAKKIFFNAEKSFSRFNFDLYLVPYQGRVVFAIHKVVRSFNVLI